MPAPMQRCEWTWKDDGRTCRRPAVAFVMGRHVCADHEPTGSPTCSHSLAPAGRCAYCGAVVHVPELADCRRTGHHRPDDLEQLELHLAHLEATRRLESMT